MRKLNPNKIELTDNELELLLKTIHLSTIDTEIEIDMLIELSTKLETQELIDSNKEKLKELNKLFIKITKYLEGL